MSLFSKVSGAGIAAAALLAFSPAAAQPPAGADTAPPEMEAPTGTRIMTVIGAIKDSNAVDAPAAREDRRVPELPVVYEDDEG